MGKPKDRIKRPRNPNPPPPQFRIQKGECRNPKGINSGPLHQLKKTTTKEFVDGLNKYGKMPMALLKIETEREDILAFDCMFATVVYRAAQGNVLHMNILMDRMWGKAKETDITPAFAAEQELMKRIPISELIALARKYKDEGPGALARPEIIEADEILEESLNESAANPE